MRKIRAPYVLYTAVLPAYRRQCLELLAAQLGNNWKAFAGEEHLDRSVKTDVPHDLYVPITNHQWLRGRLLFQTGYWGEAFAAKTTILDLNPRSVTAWALLLARKLVRRRTLLWGQLDPRKGPDASTARLRAAMRDFADGVIVYSFDSARRLRAAKPSANVWVAPNALFARAVLTASLDIPRQTVLFVGRLEPSKKPGLLLDAFALVAKNRPDWELVIIGEGSQRSILIDSAKAFGIDERVALPGGISEAETLAAYYARSICSVSPGAAGLALTQSLGFGVPMVISDGEPHGPEIELARPGSAVFFQRDSASSLATALQSKELQLDSSQRAALAENVAECYSAENMADGLIRAVTNGSQDLRVGTSL